MFPVVVMSDNIIFIVWCLLCYSTVVLVTRCPVVLTCLSVCLLGSRVSCCYYTEQQLFVCFVSAV